MGRRNCYSCSCRGVNSERGKTESGRESPRLALLVGEHTDLWLEREDLGTSILLCPGKMFWQGKLKCFFLVMAYSALFGNVFEALYLLLILFYTYVAKIQLPGNSIVLLSRTQSPS